MAYVFPAAQLRVFSPSALSKRVADSRSVQRIPNGSVAAAKSAGGLQVTSSRIGGIGVGNSNEGLVVRAVGVEGENSTSTDTAPTVEELRAKGNSYFAADSRPIILYDGVCNMCNGTVNFVLDNDPEGKLRFAALQSDAGRSLLLRSGRSPEDISTVVLVDKDRAYIKSEAVLQTAKYLGFPFVPLAFFANVFPLFLRDTVYDTVADNRYSFLGKSNACRLSDPQFEARFIS